MADIQQYLDQIAKAEQGEDVRWSIHDSIEKINQEVVIATSTANASKTAAENAATRAEQAAAEANTATESVENATWLTNLFQIYPNVRSYIRGKNLGTGLTSTQLESIRAGDFSEIRLGDFWIDKNSQYDDHAFLVVDINYPSKRYPTIYPSIEVLDIGGVESHWLDPTKTGTLGYLDCVLNNPQNATYKTVKNRFAAMGFLPEFCKSIQKVIQTAKGSGGFINASYWVPSAGNMWGFMPAQTLEDRTFNYIPTTDGTQWSYAALNYMGIFDTSPASMWLREVCSWNSVDKITAIYTTSPGHSIYYNMPTEGGIRIKASATIA